MLGDALVRGRGEGQSLHCARRMMGSQRCPSIQQDNATTDVCLCAQYVDKGICQPLHGIGYSSVSPMQEKVTKQIGVWRNIPNVASNFHGRAGRFRWNLPRIAKDQKSLNEIPHRLSVLGCHHTAAFVKTSASCEVCSDCTCSMHL